MNTMINIDTALVVPENIISISSSAQLFDLSIRTYTATKSDKKVNNKVAVDAKAEKRIGNYQKKLLLGCKTLEDVQSFAGEVRRISKSMTVPWNNNGTTLVHGKILLHHMEYIKESQEDFFKLSDLFMNEYLTAVNDASFNGKLGDLFNRADYPSEEQVRAKFDFTYMYLPIPTSGDFRIDVGNEANQELREHFEHVFKERIDNAMKSVWQQLFDILDHISKKLVVDNFDGTRGDGKKTKIHDTLLGNTEDFLNMLDALNISNDPQLDAAGKDLRMVIRGMDIGDLRKHADARKDVKGKVDAILNRYNF